MSRAKRTLGFALAITDAFLLVAAYFGAYELRYRMGWLPGALGWDRYLLLPVLALPLWLGTGWWAGLYSGGHRTFRREVAGLMRAAVVTGLVLAAFAFLLKQQHQSRPLMVLYMSFAFTQACAVRLGMRLLTFGRPERIVRTIVVGSGPGAEDLCRRISDRPGSILVGLVAEDAEGRPPPGVRLLGTIADADGIFRREVVDEVIFAVAASQVGQVQDAFASAEDLGLKAKISVAFLPFQRARVDFEELDGMPLLSFETAPGHPVKLATKRAFDLLVSGAALLVFSPVFLAIAVAIKLDSPGPVFFGQVRSGLNGRRFTLWKFRSMVVDAEKRLGELASRNEMSGPAFKMKADPRVTRVGRFLRKSSLDELPQFWNVFLGDMSVVGPRPPLPDEVARYQRWQRRRLSVKPGITCVWQVSGRNDIDFDTWMKLDLAYIDQWSLWLDLKICWKTIPAVLLGRGAR